MAHLKRRVIEVKAETNCLAHALIIAIAKITYDPNYNSYSRGCKIHAVVHNLLATKGIDLRNGWGFPELEQVQDHFKQYKIVVYTGLNCDSIMFEGKVETSDSINLLYDDITCHYHVIGSLTGAMVNNLCVKHVSKDVVEKSHIYDQASSECMASPPCV
jgi:alpha-glucuronidase